MFPLLPFVAGIFVGASAAGLVRKAKTRQGISEAMENASRKIRQTAVSSLDVIRQSSEQWRDRLASGASDADAASPAGTDEAAQAADAEDEAAASPKSRGKKERG
ncbi:MAG: hypothetical protein LBK55_00650 [Azoarcus sp.]|nr:hypothetical protein [Azoarcus sp.]